MRRRQKLAFALGGCFLLTVIMSAGLVVADREFPPPLDKADVVSAEVLDADGQLLRAFAAPDGRWRLRTNVKDVDPQFVQMLVAYEDRRFFVHHGIDAVAIGRAAIQLMTNGRIVSGASTLSMQVARLIEPRETRSFSSKLLQMARAVQIERRLSKEEILNLYLTHAPYGGNLEGVRAASLAYFGKEPKKLSVAEAALLVALPQIPERRRPDRFANIAEQARRRVLERTAVAEVVGDGEADRAESIPVPRSRLPLPALAAHLSAEALRRAPGREIYRTTIDKHVQQNLETVAQEASLRLSPKLSLAMIMADARTGDIIAEVGSAGYFDSARSGWIDMTAAARSPGSTLKPFIYGLAFEQGMVAQQTIIEDRPSDFFGYRPKNFDMSYQGDVTIREALQLSLNVPAIKLLNAVDPARLMGRLRRAGVQPVLPPGNVPGLAIGLGGVGVTLRDLVQLYTALANRGMPVRLGDGILSQPGHIDDAPILDETSVWNVADILSGLTPPVGARRIGIAYKTGTSYGYRDAWSVGYDGRHVLGVWVGRPDNASVPGLTGYGTAAPLLFEAFSRAGVSITPLPRPPLGARRTLQADLPIGLRRFSISPSGLIISYGREKPPEIVYPPEGAHIDLGLRQGNPMPLTLKLQGGRAPFRWLANGQALPDVARTRTNQWSPDGRGYSRLTVIDSTGQAASVGFFVD
ncbi:penicillin-binding protein 1C [Oryzifoliimicrobium ureilyticus]|uniref:penicillin-binding protein 1C n=1 Tax=Oryzifoliimicrobium ureilyticus TaxID=3113724 RepID=UPI003F6692DD